MEIFPLYLLKFLRTFSILSNLVPGYSGLQVQFKFFFMNRISLKVTKTVVRYNGKVLTSRVDVFSKISWLCDYFHLQTVSYTSQNVFLRNWSYMKFEDLVQYLKILVSCYNAGISFLGNVDVTSSGILINGKYMMICQYHLDLESHTDLLTSEEIEVFSKDCTVLVRPYSDFLDAAS